MLAVAFFFAAACGARTGDYGATGSSGEGGSDCKNVGEACGGDDECCTAPCESGFCGGTCTPDGADCTLDEDCCNGLCELGVCGGECRELGETCVPGQCCPPLGCEGGLCTFSECLDDGAACGTDGECCSGVCDDGVCGGGLCAPDGAPCFDSPECCSLNCVAGVCGSPGCSHDECQAGAPLDRFCTACTVQVCELDPFCCEQAWDGACVALATELCGLSCGMCTPNGGLCATPDDCCSGFCNGGVCQNPCLPDGSFCNGAAQCCSGQCSGGICGPGGDCSHDECTLGGPLLPACSPCVTQVCALDPFCCQVSWDELCVDEATQFCGLPCGNCVPGGGFCNAPGQCCSGVCNNNVCAAECLPDGSFCVSPDACCSDVCNGNVCGLPCVPDGGFCNSPGECCGNQCNNGVCGPGGDCSHDECTLGGPLLESCTPCTAEVCAVDPFCCQQGWDSICVDEAEDLCGITCGPCTPDGGGCMDGSECCSGSCENGTCGSSCEPDGAFCFDADQCCSMQCENFQCGGTCLPDGFPCGDPSQCCSDACNDGFCGAGPICPSDGSVCGDCIAGNCCGQLLGCLTSPGCLDDVFCFQSCVGGGTPLPFCLFQCIDDPAAFDVLICLAGNCSGSCL